jgi:hypothetical protein
MGFEPAEGLRTGARQAPMSKPAGATWPVRFAARLPSPRTGGQ